MKKILPIFLLLFSCTAKHQETPEQKPPQENRVELSNAQLKNAGIVTGSPEQKTLSTVIRVNGKIDVAPQNMVSISFPLSGYLKSTKLIPGMHVNKGEVLAELEDAQFIQLQQDYLSGKIRFQYLETEYNRQKDLNASKATSDKVFQQVRADYESQKVLVKGLGEKLQLIGINPESLSESTLSKSISLRSPITGYVSKVNVNIGKYVSPADVLFELINPDDIHLDLTVFQKDLKYLQEGQRVIAYSSNNPEKKYYAKVSLISRDISQQGSAGVHCHFERMDKDLIPGMFMNAEIETKSSNALVVPEEAVVKFKNKSYIFKAIDKNHFEMIQVETGIEENKMIEVLSPGKEAITQSQIVLKGAYTVLMKMKNTSEE